MTLPDLTTTQWSIVLGVLAVFVLLSFLSIRDAMRRKFPGDYEHFMWIQAVCLLPFLGPVLYFAIGRRRGEKIR